MEPNISAWRRMVTGDLTTLFDFDDPDGAALAAPPETSDAMARVIAELAVARADRADARRPAAAGGGTTPRPRAALSAARP